MFQVAQNEDESNKGWERGESDTRAQVLMIGGWEEIVTV